MYWRNWIPHITVTLFVLASIVVEMCSYKKIFKTSLKDMVLGHVQSNVEPKTKDNEVQIDNKNGYTCGVYYSNWSPYSPRLHYPHDIDLSKISHIYYSFFLVDGDTGRLKSSDEWSDFGMDLYKPLAIKLNKLGAKKIEQESYAGNLPMGLIGELNYLRHSNVFDDTNAKDFKVIMSVGGWSNREEFPKMVRDPVKFDNFIDSCVDTMFKYGFDGIDLDWEFPEDDGFEPQKYLEITRRLRLKLFELESRIFSDNSSGDHPKFQLSMATPAFSEKLNILPLKEMNEYLDTWNMMTYDYYGEWSDRTGYHSNLYDGSHDGKKNDLYKYSHSDESEEGLNGNAAIIQMVSGFGIDPSKISLGMAAYGRGFTHVKANHRDTRFIDKPFKGVGGASDGEPGMWLYNQLPIKGSQELFDPDYVSAFCFDPKSKTFVGYDNVDSVRVKARYVHDMKLAGGFWWESCGDEHKNNTRSLLYAFTHEIRSLKKFPNSMYHQTDALKYYIQHYGANEFLSATFNEVLNKK